MPKAKQEQNRNTGNIGGKKYIPKCNILSNEKTKHT